MSQPTEPTAKVLFRVPREDGGADVETLWAIPLGDDKYQLDNSPFYAYSVSWQDVVNAPYDDAEKFPTYRRVVSKSGNRTLRVILGEPANSNNQSQELLQGLLALGCDYEGANRIYISVNVPPAVCLSSVSTYLVNSSVQWEHADPTYDELHPTDA